MVDFLYDKFEVHQLNESGQNYLVLKPVKLYDETVFEYQIEMLARNPVHAVIPLEVRTRDGEIKLYYNITSLIPMVDFLKNNAFTVEKFIVMLCNMTDIIAECKPLLLYEDNFILKSRYVYVNPESQTPHLIYIPSSLKANCMEDLKELIFDAITRMDLDSSPASDHLVSKIIRYVKESGSGMSTLKKFLDEIRLECEAFKNIPEGRASEYDRHDKSHGLAAPARDESGYRNDENIETKLINADTTFMGYKLKVIFYAVVLQIALIATAVMAEKLMRQVITNSYLRYLPVMMGVLIIDILLFRFLNHLNGKDDIEDDQPLNKGTQSEEMEAPAMEGAVEGCLKSSGTEKNNKYSDSLLDGITSGDAAVEAVKTTANTSCSNNRYEKTTLLCAGNKMKGFLVKSGEGIADACPISKNPFIIGRNADVSDLVIGERSVGRIHAEIRSYSGEFYLIDRNSKNGTSINGCRLESGKEYKLQDGDVIEFANVTYRFTA